MLAGRFGFASTTDALRLLDREVQRQVMLLSFERIFAIIGLIFFASIPFVLLVPNVRPGRSKKADSPAARG
jgi:hypothetical protein